MITRLALTVSALALAIGAGRAEDARPVGGPLSTNIVVDRSGLPAAAAMAIAVPEEFSLPERWRLTGPIKLPFRTEVILTPHAETPAPDGRPLRVVAPTIAGARVLDPIITGQIAAAGGEHAAAPAGEHGGGHEGAGEGEPGAAGGPPAQAFAVERGPMPFDIIRTIQFLQDQVARGNGRAIRVQAMLLRRFGPVFQAADKDVWKDPRNLRAAILFTLSGGPPEVLRRLRADATLDDEQQKLVSGAISYVQNDLAQAAKSFGALDLDKMDPALAAHLSLVLGQIAQDSDAKAAVAHLDRARLLAPGGLIEEAALRLEVSVVEKLGDHLAADRLARQYFDRYAQSAYSSNFEARFASIFASRTDEGGEAMAKMLDIVDRLPDGNKRGIFLSVARRSLVGGRLQLADLAAKAAAETDGISPADLQRARLYQTAATLGAPSSVEIAATLAKIDRTELHPEDVKLLDAANSVLFEIDRGIDMPDAKDETPADEPGVFSRAKQLLSEVDTDLGKSKP